VGHAKSWYKKNPLVMDITSFIASQRERSLTLSGPDAYRARNSIRIAKLRKKLHIANAKRHGEDTITGEDIGANHECVSPLAQSSPK
jgi:hypothetical protein